jgi:chorismate synthase
MNKQLFDLQLQINICVHEIHDLTQDIKNMDNMIMDPDSHSLSDEEAKEQMDEIIDEYKKQVNKARILLECYFSEEDKLGEPTDFLFRRLYSKLKQAY